EFAKGAALLAGKRPFGLPDDSGIWDGRLDDDGERLRHACAWLSDLGAVGDKPARALMQAWVHDWIPRFGRGAGAGWRPGVTGERLVHWNDNLAALQKGADPKTVAALADSMARQMAFLVRAWRLAPQGVRRVQALAGLIRTALALEGQNPVAIRGATC